MSALPELRLQFLGAEPLARALRDTAAPHLPQDKLADHYALGNHALHQALMAKIDHLLEGLGPHLQPSAACWTAAHADVLALDMALVEHATQPFELAWVEIQAFTSMLPTFHTLHLAQRRLHDPGAAWLAHDAVPAGSTWLTHMRQWLAPHSATVLIEDHPRDRGNWLDLAAARHWWSVDVHDWRELVPAGGYLWHPASGRRYTHVWNRLILSDLSALDRNHAQALLLAADKLTWHSHPAWYEAINKGTLADLTLPAHEACHWVERCPSRQAQWTDAQRWVAKAVNAHSGNGVLLHPAAAQLSALPGPRQWIVQQRFRQVSIAHHPQTRQALFGEIRCMLGLRPGCKPWVMAWLVRASTDGIATMTGRNTAPGEGLTLLYFQPPPPGG
ncbi:MAG: hypothetical protein ABI300_06605 [Rhodanobacter sp.]